MRKINLSKVRRFAIAVALVSVAGGAFAQVQDTKHGWMTNGFFDNWFITVGAGAQVFEGQQDQRGDFGDRITPAFEAAIGKWFTPSVGARIQVGGLEAKGFGDYSARYIDFSTVDAEGLYEETFNFRNIHADFLLNLNNAIAGWKEHRVWNMIPYAGLGMVYVSKKDRPSRNDFAAYVGIINRFRISPTIDLDLELKQLLARDGLDGATWGTRKIDGMSTVTLGLNVKLGNSGWEKGLSKVDLDNAIAANSAAYNSRIAALERQIADEKAQIARANAEIERLRNQPKPEVTKEVVVGQPLAVFFNIESATISSKEKVNLKYAADVIKASGKKYQIKGYADKQTGSTEYNDKLALKRAQAVYDALVKDGVSKDQIVVVPRKSGEVIFNDMHLDRVAIVESGK